MIYNIVKLREFRNSIDRRATARRKETPYDQ